MQEKIKKHKAIVSNDAAEEAQAEIIQESSYGGGSALLDAEVTLEKEMDGVIDDPAATNITGDTDAEQVAIKTTGAYPASLDQLEDTENLAQDTPGR